MARFVLIDYGIGNIHSIEKAIGLFGAGVCVSVPKDVRADSSAWILPGVGAFSFAAKRLGKFKESIRREGQGGRPILGVCLGMQLFYESSDEGPGRGIALFEKRIRKLRNERLPLIGWVKTLHSGRGIFRGIGKPEYFYFVNSFAADADGDEVAAVAEYGEPFAAACNVKNVWGTQFHPEKSSRGGLKILENFVRRSSVC